MEMDHERIGRRAILGGGLGLLAGIAVPSLADDWPQWRGLRRTGVSGEKGWLTRWPRSGPNRLWSVQIGEGYSAPSVVGNRVYVHGNTGGRDIVACLNADTGRPIWSYGYPCGAGDYGGPRASPDVEAGTVYTFSREGLALCLNAVTGKKIWENDLRAATRSGIPRWGLAGSPLVYGDRVIYNVGNYGAAVDKKSGRLLWQTGGGTAGYASPVAYNLGKQWAVAIFAARSIVGVNPANGHRIWEHPWETNYEVNAADPIVSGDQIFISSNYNRGCALLKLQGVRPTVVWENRNMRNHFNTCVLAGGFLFGNDENTLKCIDLQSGQERWRSRGIDKGGVITADGKLIVLTGRGELVLASATPERYVELARAQVLRGDTWTHPVLANGRIYCRSHSGELACLDVRGR